MLNGLDLFSGYGGISRALSPWVRTVAYCENNTYRQLALLSEMQRNRIDRAPIWDDVSTLRKRHIGMRIDIVLGGWPCTGHSVAGSRTGLDHVESALAKELIRIVREFRPQFGYFENVPGVLSTGMDSVIADLAADGYVGRYGSLSCPDVGEAWHERERVWIAITDSRRIGSHEGRKEQVEVSECGDSWNTRLYGATRPITDTDGLRRTRDGRSSSKKRILHMEVDSNGEEGSFTHTHSQRLEGWLEPEEAWPALPFVTAPPSAAWPEGISEPTLLGKDDGPAEWIGQIETVGGGVVPQVAREAFCRLFGIEAIRA